MTSFAATIPEHRIAPTRWTLARCGLRLLRPKQWTKNLVCLLPLFCAGRLSDWAALAAAAMAALAFCLGASVVYIVNDLADLAEDREHPAKRMRPLAAGEVAPRQAILGAGLAGIGALALALSLSGSVAVILWAYGGLNVWYSLQLKRFPILDAMAISAGFILRLLAGAQASQVTISAWLALCAFFLSLFLAFSKRRAELGGAYPVPSRQVLSRYTALMLDRFSNISATLAIAAYSVFTATSRADHALVLTCPPVVFGIFRYLLLLETEMAGEAPELVLLRDRPIQAAIALWIVSYAAVLYLGIHFRIA